MSTSTSTLTPIDKHAQPSPSRGPDPEAVRDTVLSGITPSGALTLGNYLGALRRFAARQHEVTGYFFVADLHALTMPIAPADLRELTRQTAALFLASGLDPDVATVFVQSHVPAHVQLSYLLESTAHVGELSRMIQFKEKGGRPGTRASLFTYPCLMAADILLYDAVRVPVGTDQSQHVELCRDLAIRFNHDYGATFIVPELAPAALAAKVADLSDPGRKMNKSAPLGAGGVIRMLDPADVVRRKISRAVTDSGSDVTYEPESRPGVANLLDILASLVDERPGRLAERFSSNRDLKAAVADVVVQTLAPIQARYVRLRADEDALDRILADGARRAAAQADIVLGRAVRAIGLGGTA